MSPFKTTPTGNLYHSVVNVDNILLAGVAPEGTAAQEVTGLKDGPTGTRIYTFIPF